MGLEVKLKASEEKKALAFWQQMPETPAESPAASPPVAAGKVAPAQDSSQVWGSGLQPQSCSNFLIPE